MMERHNDLSSLGFRQPAIVIMMMGRQMNMTVKINQFHSLYWKSFTATYTSEAMSKKCTIDCNVNMSNANFPLMVENSLSAF